MSCALHYTTVALVHCIIKDSMLTKFADFDAFFFFLHDNPLLFALALFWFAFSFKTKDI